jgi:hypothetical protein
MEHLPAPTPPDWWSSVSGAVDAVNSHITGLGAWLPFPVLRTVLAAVFALLAISLAVKVVRIVASFLTAGGGSAA